MLLFSPRDVNVLYCSTFYYVHNYGATQGRLDKGTIDVFQFR